MASYLTHILAAKKTLETLGGSDLPPIDPASFYAGAAGGDAFFLYRPVRKKGYNLGRILHRKNVYGFFCAAKEYARKAGDYSYIFGYITHYAADITFHPYVYAAEYAALETLPERRRKDKIHFLIESDIDKLLADRYAGGDTAIRVPALSQNACARACALLVYAAGKAYRLKLSPDALRRSLQAFPRRQRYFCRPHGKRRKRIYRFEKALGLPHVLSYLCIRETPDKAFETLPDGKGGRKSIYELFGIAAERAAAMIRAFAAEDVPDKALFSSDFNEGKKD